MKYNECTLTRHRKTTPPRTSEHCQHAINSWDKTTLDSIKRECSENMTECMAVFEDRQLHVGAAFRAGHPLHGTDTESGAEACFNAILGPRSENSPEQMLRGIVDRSADRNARWSKEARCAPDDKLPPKVQVRLDKQCTRHAAKHQQGVKKLCLNKL